MRLRPRAVGHSVRHGGVRDGDEREARSRLAHGPHAKLCQPLQQHRAPVAQPAPHLRIRGAAGKLERAHARRPARTHEAAPAFGGGSSGLPWRSRPSLCANTGTACGSKSFRASEARGLRRVLLVLPLWAVVAPAVPKEAPFAALPGARQRSTTCDAVPAGQALFASVASTRAVLSTGALTRAGTRGVTLPAKSTGATNRAVEPSPCSVVLPRRARPAQHCAKIRGILAYAARQALGIGRACCVLAAGAG